MSDLVERLRSDGETERQRFREARATLGPLLAEAADRIKQLEEANELMLTDIRRTDVDMLAFKARIEKLESALRAVMDDLTLIGKNHWLPVGLLDDVIYVNARAALEEK